MEETRTHNSVNMPTLYSNEDPGMARGVRLTHNLRTVAAIAILTLCIGCNRSHAFYRSDSGVYIPDYGEWRDIGLGTRQQPQSNHGTLSFKNEPIPTNRSMIDIGKFLFINGRLRLPMQPMNDLTWGRPSLILHGASPDLARLLGPNSFSIGLDATVFVTDDNSNIYGVGVWSIDHADSKLQIRMTLFGLISNYHLRLIEGSFLGNGRIGEVVIIYDVHDGTIELGEYWLEPWKSPKP